MNAQSPPHHKSAKPLLFANIFIGALALSIIASGFVPRILGFTPIIIAIIGFIAYRPVFGTWPRLSKYALFWTIAIAALSLISSLWAIDPDMAIERGTKTAIILISGALLFSIAGTIPASYLRSARIILPTALIITGLIAIIELYFNGPAYVALRPTKIMDEIFNLSHLNRGVAVYILSAFIIVPLVAFNDFPRTMKVKILALIAFITILIVYKTHSQSSHLALMVGGILFFLFPYQKKIAWYALVIALFIMLATTPIITQYLFQNIAGNLENAAWFKNGYAADRMEIWDFVSRYAMNNPLYGYGVEATRAVEVFDTQLLYHGEPSVLHPHNFSVQIWIEFGIIGVLLAILFFGHLLSQIYKSSRFFGIKAQRIYLPTLFATIAISSTGYGLWQGWWLGCFMLLLSVATIAVRSLPEDSRDPE